MSIAQDNIDLINSLLGLSNESDTYAARHFREEVLTGTQASYEALFGDKLSLPLSTRWLIAVYASKLSKATELTEHYVEQAEKANVNPVWLQAVFNDDLSAIDDATVKAMLTYTNTLTLNPIAGDKAALQALEQSGVSVPDCVALAQLIAFLSYQVRLVTGIKAMQALEKLG